MNKFVIGALALTSAGSLAYAGGDETRAWSTLDRDILSLTSNQGAPAAGAFGINGFVRARGARSNDVDVDTVAPGGQDLSGFLLDNARLEVNASQGDYGAFISIDAANSGLSGGKDGTATLLDAFATFKIAEGVSGQAGRFKAPFLWSSFMVNDNNMVLLDHTFNSQNFQGRQDGVQLSGVYDHLGWWAALQNGVDKMQDKISWTTRVAVNALGTGVGKQEGAFGASGDTSIMIGAGYTDDEGADSTGNHNSGGAFCIDGSLIQGGLSVHFEVVDYQGDVEPNSSLNPKTGVINATNGLVPPASTGQSQTPWSGTVGFMLTPDVLEVVARYEDLDDDDNTTAWTLGINYYLAGHNAKWTLQGSRSNSDLTTGANNKEADTVAFGLTVGV